MRIRNMVLMGMFVLLNGCGSSKRVVYPVCNISPRPYAAAELSEETKKRYLEAVNRARKIPRQCGDKVYAAAKALVWNESLYRAAYEHSYDMAICSHFSHTGSGEESDWTAKRQNIGDRSSFVDRIENNGYTRHMMIAENIAYGMESVDEVMSRWLASEGHCANIMNPSFTEFGMAQVADANGRYYWTQTFGSQHP